MANEEAILACVEQTMVADAKLIKDAELKLFEFQKQAGFTTFLLSVVVNENVPIHVRLSSAIYMKNKIQRTWNVVNKEDGIKGEEQEIIKKQLVEALVQNVENNHLRPHLTESVRGILNARQDWNLIPGITELISSGNQNYVYAGLLILFEVCIVHRWDMIDERQIIDQTIDAIFPIIENLASQLVNQQDYRSNELLYLILKCFKYSCLNNFPRYFNDMNKVNAWVQLHLFVCAKELPKEVLELDSSDRSLDKRVKVNKWGFGNLYRFVGKYSRTTKSVSVEFTNYINTSIVPSILQEYFRLIQAWSEKSIWLSEASLYYLIELLEKCLVEDNLYPLIEPHLETIIEHLIFSCLCANQRTIELLEEDPEEYTRRYFDLNKEGSTADVASTDFIFVVGHKRAEKLELVLPFVSRVFDSFATNAADIECAYKQEGALRMVSTLFSQLSQSNDLESMFATYVVQLLSQNKYDFLIARSLETIAQYTTTFKNMDILSKIFELTYNHFMTSDVLPIKVEAADALKTLVVSNPDIHQHIGSQVPGITEKLLILSKEFELDTLSEVIESFVEHFADELTPFAENLAANLADQFLTIGRSMLENSSSNYSPAEQDQELQACALLQTMNTMVMSMNKVSLIEKFFPVVKFVIVNAQIAFLTEIVDLMDSLALSSYGLYNQFTPPIWEMVHDVMDSFQTYALDYFEAYLVFFETVVSYGFPKDQTFVEPFLTVLSSKLESDIDYDIESVLDILVFYALSMHDIPLLSKAFKAAAVEELEVSDSSVIKTFLACLSVKPLETLQLTENEGMTLGLFKKWFDHSFSSVFSIKLQILAITSILRLPEIPGCISGFVSEFASKLVDLTATLPKAIRRRDAMSEGNVGIDDLLNEEAADDEGFFEEFEDDMKETVLDPINAFQEVSNFMSQIQAGNPERYQKIISSLSVDKKDTLTEILKFVAEN